MHVFFALEGTALFVESVNDFSSELVGHGFAATLAGIDDEVFHRDGLLAVSADFSGHLEGSTANAAALNLNQRSHIIESLLPDFKSSFLFIGHFGLDGFKSRIEDGESGVLLAVIHKVVNELGHLNVVKHRIGENHPLLRLCLSHCCGLSCVFSFRGWLYI